MITLTYLAKALSALDTEAFSGWLMASAVFELKKGTRSFTPAPAVGVITKRRTKIAYLSATTADISLTVTLVRSQAFEAPTSYTNTVDYCTRDSQSQNKDRCEYPNPDRLLSRFCISHQEIKDYLADSLDTNPIHQTKQPIIPGICLCQYLLPTLISNQLNNVLDMTQLQFRFLHPVYPNQMIDFYQSSHNEWRAYVGQTPICSLHLI